MKTSKLIGRALNWAVAKSEGLNPNNDGDEPKKYGLGFGFREANGFGYAIKNYSTDWSQGGPIIEREGIYLRVIRKQGHALNGVWLAAPSDSNTGSMVQWVKRPKWKGNYFVGPTPLIAAMRALVASKLGDEVDIPEGLIP